MKENDYYLLALNRIHAINSSIALKLQEHWPVLKKLFNTPAKELIKQGLTEKIAYAISKFNFERVEYDINYCQKNHCQIITYNDKRYPRLLREIAQPPLVLFARGDTTLLNTPSLAIVGTRKPTPMGRKNAHLFAQMLSQNNLSIISGLAIGIDTICHQATLEENGKTIAVMATGIDEIYPRRNHHLAKEIEKKGLIITEFPCQSPPTPRQFPRRNRIISGLSLGILVIEAAIKSGSLITAKCALDQNREVFALPGAINNPLSQGCHLLVQQGAKLVTDCLDILSELQLPTQTTLQANKKIEKPLDKRLQNLVKFVNYDVTSIDNIVEKCGLQIDDLLSQLVELELLGLIHKVPGGYERC